MKKILLLVFGSFMIGYGLMSFNYKADTLSIFIFMIGLYLFVSSRQAIPTKQIKPLAYKVYLTISPHWDKIVGVEIPSDDEYLSESYKFQNKVLDDEELEMDKERSLFGKEFYYTIFKDESSGMEQVWSSEHKAFFNEILEYDYIIRGNLEKFREKYGVLADKVKRNLIITPEAVGYPDEPFGGCYVDEVLSGIPYYHFIKTLKKIHRYSKWDSSAMWAIKKFSKGLQKQFDEHKVMYDVSMPYYASDKPKEGDETVKKKYLRKTGVELYNSEIDCHILKSPYYDLYIRIKFFDRFNPEVEKMFE